MIVKLKDLEKQLNEYLKMSITQESEEILRLMVSGVGPYKICRLCGLDTYQAENKIKKELAEDFNRKQIEDIFQSYFRILYFPLLRFEKGMVITDFINNCETYIKNQTYADFLNFLPNPGNIFSHFLDDTEILREMYSLDLNKYSIFRIEETLKIQFEIRHKISNWLRYANVAYYKGNYIDFDTKEILEFSY